MSAFVMTLAAGMAVGNGPETVSADVDEGLILLGAWTGTFRVGKKTFRADFNQGKLQVTRGGVPVLAGPWNMTDEGGGKFRAEVAGCHFLGIYHREGGHVILCCRDAGQGRPASFEVKNEEILLTLRRVKPGK
jgi:hypothetical protein